jgi:hypothetical protein
MLEGYVIAEVAKIFEDAYVEVTGSRVEHQHELNKMVRLALPNLDNYFGHRLFVDVLKKEIDELANKLAKVEQDKGSNDKDYLELSAQNNALLKEIKFYKGLLAILVDRYEKTGSI